MAFDPVHDGRPTFLACLRAQCSPGTPQGPIPPAHLSEARELASAAAILLALLDPGLGLASVGSDDLHDVAARVCSITGAHDAVVADADFVLVAAEKQTGVARQARRGTALMPELGATVIYCSASVPRIVVRLTGPGIDGSKSASLGIAADELDARAAANASPPAGIDVLVVDGDSVLALPRSTAVARAGS